MGRGARHCEQCDSLADSTPYTRRCETPLLIPDVRRRCRRVHCRSGIVAQPLRRAQIEIISLRPEPLVFVCSPEHRLARRRNIALSQLEGEPFVAFDRNGARA
jgi:DNA-binding transcriptional LysR family regulator